MNFDLQAFISVLHSIGGGALVMLYILMADGYSVMINTIYYIHVCVLTVYPCMYIHVYVFSMIL